MAAVIKLKRSNTGGSAPSGGTLQAGELALNTADRKLFSSTNGSDIITISGDRYNIDTTAVTHTGGGATIRLTKDGAAYDDIDILGYNYRIILSLENPLHSESPRILWISHFSNKSKYILTINSEK